MLQLSDLKSVKILSNFSEPMLKKIKELTFTKQIPLGEFVFKEGDYAEYLYAVSKGKVSLEIDASSGIAMRFKDIYPGRIFGISSVVDTDRRTFISAARALEDTTVLCWKSSDLEKLFYSDYELGFLFMRNISKVAKIRLQATRAQLIQEMVNTQS